MSYQERTYRRLFSGNRFQNLNIQYKESDIWIAVSPATPMPELEKAAREHIRKLRSQLEAYISHMPAFLHSLLPLPQDPSAPPVAREMIKAALAAGTGPMAAVAGAFAHSLAKRLLDEFSPRELIIENGGDLAIHTINNLDVSLWAGNSPLSQKVGLRLPPQKDVCGICTSSGTVGHSYSKGKADAAMVICDNTALADAMATAVANKILAATDINPTIEQVRKDADIDACIIIFAEQMGICGNYELIFLNSDNNN